MTNDQSGARTDRVMVDIETLGLEPGSAILSIDAAEFGGTGLVDIAEQVGGHGRRASVRRAERPAQHGPDVVLEL